MAKQKSAATEFGEHTGKLFKLFAGANQEQLKTALEAKDFSAICAALGVSEQELTEFLGEGAELTRKLLEDTLKEAITAFKRSAKV